MVCHPDYLHPSPCASSGRYGREGLPCGGRAAGREAPGCRGWGTGMQPCRPKPPSAAGRPGGPRSSPPASGLQSRERGSRPRTRARRPIPRVHRLELRSLNRGQTPSPPSHLLGPGRQAGRGCQRPPPADQAARRHGNRPGRSPPARAVFLPRGRLPPLAPAPAAPSPAPLRGFSTAGRRPLPPQPLPPGAGKGLPALQGRGETAAAGLCPRRAGPGPAPARLRHRGLPRVGEEEEEEGLRSGNN